MQSTVNDKESRQYAYGHLTPAPMDSDATTKNSVSGGNRETCLREVNMIKIECSYCKAQQLPDGRWISKDVKYYPRFPQSKDASHGICPECLKSALSEI